MKAPVCVAVLTVALAMLSSAHAEEREKTGGTPAAETRSAGNDGAASAQPERSNTSSTTARKTLDAEKRALDLLLAETLTDPMSAIQYRVSTQTVSCNDTLATQHGRDWNGQSCICYEVNTRGENNGYQGSKTKVATLRREKDGSFSAAGLLVQTDNRRMWTACSAAGWEKRPSKLIHAEVN